MLVERVSPLTPVEEVDGIYLKRDDLFEVGGARGGKARTCWALSKGAKGLVTAGGKYSTQNIVVATIGAHLDIPVHVHTAYGKLTPELRLVKEIGAAVIQHKPGYTNVIVSRAKLNSIEYGYKYIPFGMDCWEAVHQTRYQVKNLPNARRLVVPVGSSMTLSGILHGIKDYKKEFDEVMGVVIGAPPYKKLNYYAPYKWRDNVMLVPSGVDYKVHVEARINGIVLDPIYEAKCLPVVRKGDVFWLVGAR